MSEIEKRARTRRRKENLQATILGMFVGVGVLSVAVVAPNAVKLLKFTKLDTGGKQKIGNAFNRLLKKGYLVIESSEKGKRVRLTPEGERALILEYRKVELMSGAKRKWDGQWRVVIFDISEKRRKTRDQLRALMLRVGFKQLQGSVWVFPYECEELLTLIKGELKIGKDVLYMVVSALENDEPLRKHFNLPLS